MKTCLQNCRVGDEIVWSSITRNGQRGCSSFVVCSIEYNHLIARAVKGGRTERFYPYDLELSASGSVITKIIKAK